MSDSEIGQAFTFLREINREKRKDNTNKSRQILLDKGINFVEKNQGKHLIVKHGQLTVDFWPSTGLYIPRHTKKRGYGVFNLLKLIGCKRADDTNTEGQTIDSVGEGSGSANETGNSKT